MPVKAKYIKDLPLKRVLDGSESLLVQDLNGTQQAPLEMIVDEIKQNSQEKIREIESELNQTNAQLSYIAQDTIPKIYEDIQSIPKGEKGDKGDPGTASVSIDDSKINTSQTWSSNKINERNEIGLVNVGTEKGVNINTTNNTLEFGNNSNISWKTGFYIIPNGTTVDLSTATSVAKKILFNTSTKIFRCVNYSVTPTYDEILVCTIRGNTINGIYPYSVNSVDLLKKDIFYGIFLTGGNKCVEFDTNTMEFIIPKDSLDFILYHRNGYYSIPKAELRVPIPTTGTGALLLTFDSNTKEFSFIGYSLYETLYASDKTLIATIRRQNGINVEMFGKYKIDGKLYGDIGEEVFVVQNSKDANIKAINHRGYNSLATENTLDAYRWSKKKGFSYVECDVRFTSDGVPVLLHDQTIDRTSNGSGNITEMTFEEVRTYDFGNGQQIPTFEEFIILCKKLDLCPYIEIKDITNGSVKELTDIVKKLGMVKNCTWITNCNEVKKEIPNARLSVLGELSKDIVDNLVATLKTENNEVLINTQNTSAVTKELVEYANMNGIGVDVWNISSSSDVIRLAEYGVSGMTTDTLNIASILKD